MNSKSEYEVKVAVRIRPLNEIEKISSSSECVSILPDSNQIIVGSESSFTFDHVFDQNSTQLDIYNACVDELLTCNYFFSFSTIPFFSFTSLIMFLSF